MLSSLKKMRGDKKGWYKVSDLRPGLEIAVPVPDIDGSIESSTRSGDIMWDEIISIKPVGREKVYDIEVEGTHNFVGNGIFAHNTYVLRANTALAVEGEVNAVNFIVPTGSQNSASSTLISQIPPSVLTADGKGVDIYKLATYNLSATQALAERVGAGEVRVTSLETRVTALESGAISSASGTPFALGSSTLASALEGIGVLIQNGIAQFNTLVFRQLVASNDADGTSSAGSVSILTGNMVSQVSNSLVLPSTKVFVTFNSSVNGSWWVSDKTAGSFRVVLSAPQVTDVSFDYFLVQTEGQLATSTPSTTTTTTTAPAPAPTFVPTTTPAPSTSTTTPLSTDTVPPVVTLIGDAAMQITVGDTFTDLGATAVDAVDGDITANIVVTGAVDTALAGSYSLTYTATDIAGNSGSVSRLVTVVAPPAPAPEPAPAT